MTNLHEAQTKGIAVVINWNDLTEERMLGGIRTVLKDDNYQKNVDRVGRLMMDQPLHPVDRATWWMEYVLRHPGKGMKSPAQELHWWQYFLLDVMLVIGLVVGVVVGGVGSICWLLCRKKKTKQE